MLMFPCWALWLGLCSSSVTLEGREPLTTDSLEQIVDSCSLLTYDGGPVELHDTLEFGGLEMPRIPSSVFLGASDEIEVHGDTLFLHDRGIQYIFEGCDRMLLRFTDTGNIYVVD